MAVLIVSAFLFGSISMKLKCDFLSVIVSRYPFVHFTGLYIQVPAAALAFNDFKSFVSRDFVGNGCSQISY